MEKIKNPCNKKILVKFGKIKSFINQCKVSGELEMCNIELSYVPNKYVIELDSYRKYFEEGFNEYIEKIAENVFNHIDKLIKPKKLFVKVYLIEKSLTPWSVEIKK